MSRRVCDEVGRGDILCAAFGDAQAPATPQRRPLAGNIANPSSRCSTGSKILLAAAVPANFGSGGQWASKRQPARNCESQAFIILESVTHWFAVGCNEHSAIVHS